MKKDFEGLVPGLLRKLQQWEEGFGAEAVSVRPKVRPNRTHMDYVAFSSAAVSQTSRLEPWPAPLTGLVVSGRPLSLPVP